MRLLARPTVPVLLLLLAVPAACADARLTEPRVFAHEADGRLWVAVTRPEPFPQGEIDGRVAPSHLALGLDALDDWVQRAARSAVGEGLDPAFDRARAEVAAAARAGRGAMRQGDHLEAVRYLAAGGAAADEVAPAAVAARVIDRAEIRLRALPSGGDGSERALRLLRAARLALQERDDPRALRRALYALQVAEAALADAGSDG